MIISFFLWNMVNRVLYVGFNLWNKNMFFVIYHQACKSRIAVWFKVISILDFNTLFIYLFKCYIQYIIGI